MAKDRSDDPPSHPPDLAAISAQLDMFGSSENRAARRVREGEIAQQTKPAARAKRPPVPQTPQEQLPIMRLDQMPDRRKEARSASRAMKEHELASPVDISATPIDRGDSLRWTSKVIATATLVLLVANAGTLAAWVDEKPPTALQIRMSEMAGGWNAAMDAIGVTAPRRKLHETWKAMQAARFGEEAPAEGQ